MAKKQKLRGRGLSRGDRFVRLEFYLLNSPAWLTLSPPAKALYVEVCKRYNGVNNGTISYSVREAEAIGLSRSAAGRAFDELQERGFLRVARESSFTLKTKEARLWRLTAFPAFGNDATKDFMRWTRDEPSEEKPQSQNKAATVPLVGP